MLRVGVRRLTLVSTRCKTNFSIRLTDEQSAALNELLKGGVAYGFRQLDAFEQACLAGKSIDDAKLAFRNAGPGFDA